MSVEPRNSPARCRLLVAGRANVATFVAAASVMGVAAGAVVPALADNAPRTRALAACADPLLATATVTIDGNEFECANLHGPPTGTPPGREATTAADAPAAPVVPTDPALAAPAPTAAPDTGVSSEPPPAALPVKADPGSKPVGVSPHMPALAAERNDRPRNEQKPNARTGRGPARVRHTKIRSHGTSKPTAKPDARAKPRPGTALPASWTSLTPLTLPAFGVEGFPIPPFLLPIYQAAGAQYGVPWEILASINEIETGFGRNAGVSSAGAVGWMQFIRSSWERWGTDADADRHRDPRNPVDAIFAAARYLHGAGARTDLPKAIFAYNHANWYVDRVVERAREFAGLDRTLVAALSRRALLEDVEMYRARGNPFAGHGAIEPSPGQALLLTKRQLTRIVLRSKDIDIYPGGRRDIADGHVDRRVLATLVFLARSGRKPTVSSLTTGHALRTTSGNISAHSYGHAVDISAINGVAIAGHQGADSITAKTLDRLVRMQGYLRPSQIISLMTVDGQDNTLSMGDHDDHIHVGFPRLPRAPDGARPTDIVKLVSAFRAKPPRR